MKLFDLQESSPFDTVPFASKAEEIQTLKRKKASIEYHQKLIQEKLNKMYPNKFKSSWNITSVTSYELDNYPDGKQLIIKYAALGIKSQKVEGRLQDLRIKGFSFCFTGFRDAGLEHQITKQGGRIVATVSSTTTYLVRGDKDKTSGKMLKAQQTGAKIITRAQLEDFLRP